MLHNIYYVISSPLPRSSPVSLSAPLLECWCLRARSELPELKTLDKKRAVFQPLTARPGSEQRLMALSLRQKIPPPYSDEDDETDDDHDDRDDDDDDDGDDDVDHRVLS